MSVSVRPLTPDEQRQLVAARLVAVEHAPYLAHALFSVAANAAEGLGTFAVDRGWRLYLDPATLAGWGPALSGGVLVHEISHLVRAHAERADALGAPYDHDRWNIATDAAINDDLLAAGIQLPRGAVTPAGLGLEEGGIEETYYAQLADQRLPSSATGSEWQRWCRNRLGYWSRLRLWCRRTGRGVGTSLRRPGLASCRAGGSQHDAAQSGAGRPRIRRQPQSRHSSGRLAALGGCDARRSAGPVEARARLPRSAVRSLTWPVATITPIVDLVGGAFRTSSLPRCSARSSPSPSSSTRPAAWASRSSMRRWRRSPA